MDDSMDDTHSAKRGRDKLTLRVNLGLMNKAQAEKYMKEQARMFSRKLEYNPITGKLKCAE